MKLNLLIVFFSIVFIFSCNTKNKTDFQKTNVQCVGAMKDVMWKGKLKGSILLDTLPNKNGLYGLGPVEYLRGELLIIKGKSYKSTVLTDSTMQVEETFNAKAPFFVFGNVTNWEEELLPEKISTIRQLESYINDKTKNTSIPFVFKLKGDIQEAKIHIQNLPKGSKISSPTEAHQGQINYSIKNEVVDIVGFFSTEHKGIFTHHDTNIHMHLITTNRQKMGHLDKVIFKKGMRLYLPK
ncbi:MAG: acetolactate decarboxylase [Cellulophaga sp.]